VSATGRSLAAETGYVRHADDFYETPAWCTRAILPHLRRTDVVLDPCAGTGAILRAVRTSVPGVICKAIELDPVRSYHAGIQCADALSPETLWPPATIVTNPPYALAMEFVLRALLETQGKRDAAFLLRLNWLASQKRAEFHKKHPSDIFVLPRRPSFTPDNRTDATEYAWLVWGPGRGNRWQILDV